MILVVGATGTNGRVLVDRLAKAGNEVRALVRTPAKAEGLRSQNVEIVAGDFDDQDSLEQAFQGVDHAFFVAAVDQRMPIWSRNFLHAAAQSGRPHVVKLSAMGAAIDSTSELMRQHAETDQTLVDSGLPFTILRPNSFFQNILGSAQTIKTQSAFYMPIGTGRVSMVDVRDVAEVASKALTEPGHEGHAYEITGLEALTFHDVAAKLSLLLGRPIRYVDAPPEAAFKSMTEAGMPEWSAHAIVELFGVFARNEASEVTKVFEAITGHEPTTFSQFVTDHLSAFR